MSSSPDRITVIHGDITQLRVDAIVNAARRSLLGGGGVDGAIHEAAGPELLEECRSLGGCEFGEAKVTKGYKLPARYVIHTVGPTYWKNRSIVTENGKTLAEVLLRRSYCNSLYLATKLNLLSIAFPSISTGAYLYPIAEASAIAADEVVNYLEKHSIPEAVVMVAYTEEDYTEIKSAFDKRLSRC